VPIFLAQQHNHIKERTVTVWSQLHSDRIHSRLPNRTHDMTHTENGRLPIYLPHSDFDSVGSVMAFEVELFVPDRIQL
jgi:hypothetical protein